MLAVQSDELAAYALELWEGHGRRWQLNGLFDIGYSYLTTSFTGMVLLVYHYLREDIGRRFVEFVEVVLLGRRFLLDVRRRQWRWAQSTHQNCCQVGPDSLHLAVAAYHGIPYLVARRRLIFLDHDEQRAVPSRHAIGLFIAKDQVLKDIFVISPILLRIRQEFLVVLATSIGRGTYVQL